MNELLRKGDKVGIVSLSSFLPNQECIGDGLDYLRSLGLTPVLGKHIFDRDRYTAGSALNRADDLMSLYNDHTIKAIFATSGGAGSAQLLPLLDYDMIKENPKPLIGFSDLTSVQNAIISKTGQISISGFLLKYDFKNGEIDPKVDASLRDSLFSDPNLTLTFEDGKWVKPNPRSYTVGKLIGGNLTCFARLCGTPYLPSLDGVILLLEDVGEEPYKIELMLNQIRQQPDFHKLCGVVFGSFTNCVASTASDGTVDDVIDAFAENYPMLTVIKNFSYGHIPSRYVVHLGRAHLLYSTKERVYLKAI